MDQYIVYNKTKLKNPTHDNNLFAARDTYLEIFDDHINNYQFNKYFTDQYEKIDATLPPEFKLTHILSSKFKRLGRRSHRDTGTCYNFIAFSPNKNIMWQKKDSFIADDKGYNYIYYNGIKYKTSEWLRNYRNIM